MSESVETVITTRYLDKPTGRRPLHQHDPAIHSPVNRYVIKTCIECGQEFERPAGWRKTMKCPDCGNAFIRHAGQMEPETIKAVLPRKTWEPIAEQGFVYLILLIVPGISYYKIGCTKNLIHRSSYFELHLPFDFEIIHSFPADNMYQAERELHLRFTDKRVKGEWFTLTDEDVSFIKSIG